MLHMPLKSTCQQEGKVHVEDLLVHLFLDHFYVQINKLKFDYYYITINNVIKITSVTDINELMNIRY